MFYLIISLSLIILLVLIYYVKFKNKPEKGLGNQSLRHDQRCKKFFAKNKVKYESLCCRDISDPENPFWDIIVVTASDQSQCETYQMQIEEKIRNKLIPSACEYRVYPDPGGVKIGSGGATMRILDKLRGEFGWRELSEKRMMLIHAGGYSQRLPSLTAIGKLSISLPLGDGNELYQVFEGLLICFLDFPRRMKNGIMLCACDALFLYSDENHWKFEDDGFVTMGSVVPIEQGLGHGVLDFQEMPKIWDECCNEGSQVYLRKLNQFLHKYSASNLRKLGAVHLDKRGREFVYQDSNFFISWSAAEKLVRYYDENQPIQCEIDAYGDFLKAAAAHNSEYIFDTGNVVQSSPLLIKTRKSVYEACRSIPVSALVFNTSAYLHFGTSKEYMDYTADLSGRLLSSSKEIFIGKSVDQSSHYQDSVRVMGCFLKDPISFRVDEGSLLEYCVVEPDVSIGAHCFISHCHLTRGMNIPDNTYMFSVAINGGESGFVTPIFGIKDNLKKSSLLSELASISYLGTDLQRVYTAFKEEGYDLFQGQNKFSLWYAKLFPIFSSLTLSAANAVENISQFENSPLLTKSTYISMQDIVSVKDTRACLTFELDLRNRILFSKKNN